VKSRAVEKPRAPSHQVDLGDRVRSLRAKLGLSLRALAEETGFSPSFISQLENGAVSPSLGSLEKIAEALGIGLRDFFVSPEDGRRLVIRRGERQQATSTWSHARLEAVSVAGQRLGALMITLESGGRSGKHPKAQANEELGFVMRGEVVLTLDDERHVMRVEDAVVIPAGMRRLWTNESGKPACVLIVSAR
jgi:transcriptional regulator with XRE-family HTH domain